MADSQQLVEYFNIRAQGPITSLTLFVCLLIAVACIIMALVTRKTNQSLTAGTTVWPSQRGRLFSWIDVGRRIKIVLYGAAVIMAAIGIVNYLQFSRLQGALFAQKFTVVEGRVADFHPAYAGNKEESFQIGSVRIGYVGNEVTAAFHQTKANGGPIAEGLYVRAYIYDGRILRLWIEKQK